MTQNKTFKIIILLGLIGIGFYFFSQLGASDREYAEKIEKERQEIDRNFRSGSKSPIPEAKRTAFKGLSYYTPDPKLRFQVTYEKLPQLEPVDMQMTGNNTERYLKYATVTFELEAKPHTLFLYQRPAGSGDQRFFLPFTDLTNGHETYGGGRYLDVEVIGPGQVALDFNKAYSPYCAHNHEFSCPIPPKENHVPAALKAGEKSEK